MTYRKRLPASFWITVALLAVLVAYPLSFGPACWVGERSDDRIVVVSQAYRPIGWIALHIWPIGPILGWYGRVGLPPGVRVGVPNGEGMFIL